MPEAPGVLSLEGEGGSAEAGAPSLTNGPAMSSRGVAGPRGGAQNPPRLSAQDTTPKKLVYVMGAGRSGSTALGVALDNVDGLFYCGELFPWFLFRGKPSFGRPDVVEFWEGVGRRTPELTRHFGDAFYHRWEHHKSILRPWRWFDRRARDEFVEANLELVRAVEAQADGAILVDGSHYPMRLFHLRRLPGVEIHLVHFVRDPRSVIQALQKPVQRSKPMHPAAANLYCWVVAALSIVVKRLFPAQRRTTLRYEDFVADPVTHVNRIAESLQIAGRLRTHEDLPTGRMFQGNRLRQKDTISIRPQPSSTLLGRAWRILSTVVQAPILLAYGYPLRGGPGGR